MNSTSHEPNERRRVVVAAALCTAVLYASTLFPGVGGAVNHGDSAKFQFLGVVVGIGHPPGNPLYLLLLYLAQHLPFGGEPWMRANLVSALCASLTVGLLADAMHRLAGKTAALGAAASLALGGLCWTFGTEAEVYSFAAVFLAGAIDALVIANAQKSGKALGVALALMALGLGSHLSLAFAGPALLVTTILLHRSGARLSLRDLRPAVVATLVTIGLYALLPYVHGRGVDYSEYAESLDFRGLLAFVGAERFRTQLVLPTLDQALHERPRAMVALLDRQWMLPIWFVVPIGLVATFRRQASLGVFVGLAALGWLAFAFLYQIPDPEGFYLPLCVVGAAMLGVAVAEASRPRLALLALALALLPGVVFFHRTHQTAMRFDVLEDVGYGIEPEMLDLPDLVRRIPEGSLLALPCGHYGCIEVSNYYRFADPTARRRRIEIVTVLGGTPYSLPSPPRILPAVAARARIVCTIHVFERDLLARSGVTMRTIERGVRPTPTGPRPRLPVFCSVPGAGPH